MTRVDKIAEVRKLKYLSGFSIGEIVLMLSGGLIQYPATNGWRKISALFLNTLVFNVIILGKLPVKP